MELVSDSQYVLKGLMEWRGGWERKGFRNSKGEPVANLALWKRLFAVADARRVTTRWVRGHNGDPHNERADALANKALACGRSSAALSRRGARRQDSARSTSISWKRASARFVRCLSSSATRKRSGWRGSARIS